MSKQKEEKTAATKNTKSAEAPQDDQPATKTPQVDDKVDKQVDDKVDKPVDDKVDKPVDDKVDKPVDDKVDKPVDDKVDKPVDDKVDKPAGKKKKKIRYAFPTVSRCPRCKTTDTVAYRTAKNIQYRRCLRAICRWSYSVRGKKV